MTLSEVIDLIQEWIVTNGNEEITADVLRPILEAMVNQPNELIGDLDNLNTTDKDNLVEAINEVKTIADSNTGLTIHTGSGLPTVTPPVSYSLGDFYAQIIYPSTDIVSFWQWNGLDWVQVRPLTVKTVRRFVSLVGIDTTGKTSVEWAWEAIDAAITGGANFSGNPGNIIDFYFNIYVGENSIRRFYFRWLNGHIVTVSGSDIDPYSLIMPDGEENIELSDDLIIDLGDIGSDNVWDAFNTDPNQPFEIEGDKFVSAIQNGENKLWQWLGGDGTFGSTGTPAVEADFLDLTEQPTIPPTTFVILDYEDIAALLSHQEEQVMQGLIYVDDASADTNLTFPVGETRKYAYYQYLGTTTGTMADYELISAPYGTTLAPKVTADTGTAIDLGWIFGNECNMLSANTNSAFTLTNIKPGGEATVLINRSTEPTVTGATKISGHTFQASTNMHLKIKCRQTGIVQYYFLKI
jgi:hypothetical protein